MPLPRYASLLLAAVGPVMAEASRVDARQADGGSSSHGGQAGPTSADMESFKYYAYLATVLASTVGALLIYHMVIRLVRYIRTITCLSNDGQRYFAIPSSAYAWIKQHVLYAPLFRSRHSSETSGWDLGVLPTRFQSMFLAGYIGSNVAFCVVSIDWNGEQKQMLAEFRHRTGILSTVNMIPLFIMAGRNNPLIRLLDISYDSFNLMHRWFGRVVVIEAVCHTAAYLIAKVKADGWSAVVAALNRGNFLLGGLLATAAMAIILLQSPAMVRHAFYETFLHLHIALALLAVVGLWLHLKDLPQMKVLLGVVVLWVAERGVRALALVYRNLGHARTRALVETLPGDAVRVTLDMARPWTSRPGQHIFLYMPSVGLWTSHPFSVAWAGDADPSGEKGMELERQQSKSSISLVIRRRTGFTENLYRKAEQAKGKLVLTAFAEGPYGGNQDLDSYGTVMLFAGGVGITHQVLHVRQLVEGFANGTVAARRIVLVWVIQSPEHLEWIRPWMTTILAIDRRRDVLRVLLFVTRPRSTKEIHSPSATVQMFPGKPNVDTLVALETENQVGAMGVTVCGPGSLADDVRGAVRKRQGVANIDFVEASYSW
ncbi:MAG: hypothetical protein M1832_003187 [Thelocarpon impressellum]|nr:MAG: hypothetical protein M1832_003187 [Thelocarpon impressellum]